MREIILFGKERLFKLYRGGKNQLVIGVAENGRVISQRELTKSAVEMFSADIDKNDCIYIAAITEGSLVHIKMSGERVSTTHLMHLPNAFNVNSLELCYNERVHIFYCVKSREGCAIIEYSSEKDSWRGRNVFTDSDETEILCVDNGCACYAVKCFNGKYTVLNCDDRDEPIFQASSKIAYAQIYNGELLLACGNSIYKNGTELCTGSAVYISESNRACVRNNGLYEIVIGTSPKSLGRLNEPSNATEYYCCECGKNKRIMLSSPFPAITREMAMGNNGLSQEVYMQQRTIFELQAELREIKARLRRLEENKIIK